MLEQWRDRFGDPFLLQAFNGPLVITGREDLIREVYGTDPDVFEPFAVQTLVPILGAGSIFALTGSEHRRERKLLMPMFHGDRMRTYGASMCQQALDLAQRELPSGRVQTLPLMTDISYGVIVRNIIGGTSGQALADLIGASKAMVRALHPLLLFSARTHVSFLGLSPWDRLRKAKAELCRQIEVQIDHRRSGRVEYDDILSLLCQSTYEDGQPMTREHICDEMMTFLFAGHETTALSLTWAMYHLHRHPAVRDRLLRELDSIEGTPAELAAAPYLKACIQETLRIHPIATETLRKLNQPMVLGEYRLPAGHGVAMATVLAHYNPQVYPDPEEFRPERFLERSYSPFTYMPFGGGHRRCVGAAFASYEMAMVLGTLLRQFQFELVEAAEVRPVRRNVTMGPSSLVPLRIAARC